MTSESWTSNCRLYTKDPAKEHGVFFLGERVRAGLKKETKVAKVAKMQNQGGNNSWQTSSGKEGGRG